MFGPTFKRDVVRHPISGGEVRYMHRSAAPLREFAIIVELVQA